MSVSIIDLIVLAALIYASYLGFKKGLIVSLALLIGLALGVWGAKKFSDYASAWLLKTFDINIPTLSFALTFLLILLLVYLLGKLIEKSVSMLLLGWANKIGGILFSLGKAILILSICVYLFEQINQDQKLASKVELEQSVSYPILKKIEEFILPKINAFKV